MVRRKLTLSSNTKGQSTISSFFAKKSATEQSKPVNGQDSSSLSCNTSKASVGSTNVQLGSNASAKRPLVGVNTELPLVQSLKKAKISDSGAGSNPSSPDIIPATPEDDRKKCARPLKPKSKRKISFVLTPQTDQTNDGSLKKHCEGSAVLPTKKETSSVTNVMQPSNNSCDRANDYSTSQDPLLAEILGDLSAIDSTPSTCYQNTGSKPVKASKNVHQSYETSIVENGNLQPEKSSLTGKIPEYERCESVLSTPSTKDDRRKLDEFGHSSKSTKSVGTDSGLILKDSTATKSSPNKSQSSLCPIKSCEVKPKNIFLDGAPENSPSRVSFFVRRISHKNKSIDKPDSKWKELKTPDPKSQVPSPRNCDLLTNVRSSDAFKNAHAIVESNPTLSVLKTKLMKNTLALKLSVKDNTPHLENKSGVSEEIKDQQVCGGENLVDKDCKSDSCTHTSNNELPHGRNSKQEVSHYCGDTMPTQNAVEKMSPANLAEQKVLSSIVATKLETEGHQAVSVQNVTKGIPEQNSSNFSLKMDVDIHEDVTCRPADCFPPSDLKDINSVPKEDSVGPSESSIPNSNHTTFVSPTSLSNKCETQGKPGDSFEDFDMECFEDDWTLSQFHTDKKPETPASYEETLDLTSPVHCKVLSIVTLHTHRESKMWLECVKSGATASCSVRGSWLSTDVESNNIVCVEAVLADESSCSRWLIDDVHGMLVMHPDTLISGTAVVGSLFCERRSVLSDSYRGFDGSNGVMAIGTLVHEILQEVLKKNLRKLEDIKQLAESMLSHPNTVRLCYDADMSFADVRKELNLFLPSIENFISKYVTIEKPRKTGNWLGAPARVNLPGDKQAGFKKDSQEWSGNIIGIEDIEENLWDPMLGIKGKIDVTVKVKESCASEKILPLELKTGRASHSAEHRGQVMLYSMMMSRLGTPVNSGLLLYLRESSIREVKLSHREKRDLLMLRNRLAQNLEVQSKVNVEDIENVPALPEPIHFEKACSKCPYLTICSVHLKREKERQIRDGHPMISLSVESTKHLTPAHTDYFFYWTQLIRLETQEQRKSIHQRNIWSLTPEKREKLGQALVNLRVEGAVTEDAGKFSHNFVRNHDVELVGSQPLSDDFRKCSLNVGDYIIVSTNTRIAVDTGFILAIDTTSICLSLNRDLRKRNANDIFHLDTYESNYATASNLTNLSCLLDDTYTAKRVREAVIDRVPPTFSFEIKADVLEELTPILANLNSAQREAAMAVLRSDRYALIKGLPGTGKTATMVALVCLLVKLGQSVLITSQTHSAVDNLLLRLKHQGVNFLRLGSAARIHPELKKHSEGFVTQHCHTPEDLATVLETYQVVGVTCLGMNHPMFFRGRVFDICLVDESTQVLQSTVLRPLLNANRFVLVGDPDQLPPVVQSARARELGLGESLFARLDQDSATKSLDLNYRMNQTITDLANSLTYRGMLKCGDSKVARAVLDLPNVQEVIQGLPSSNWLSQILLQSLTASVFFLDSGGARIDTPQDWEESVSSEFGSRIETTLINFYEVKVLKIILEALIKAGMDPNEVGIIAPYRAQVTLIRKVLEPFPECSKIEVNSVDQYQGRDKQVILFSCTRSDSSSRLPKDYEILNDHRRLTVAITRAKCKLLLIGDVSTLKNYAPFAKLFACLSPEQNIKLPSQF